MLQSIVRTFCFTCLLFSNLSLGNEVTRVDADLKEYDSHVAGMNTEFNKIPSDPSDKSWVKKKLQHMFDVDQYMRNYWSTPFNHQYSETEKKSFQKEFESRASSLDASNTDELKKVLKVYRWITISAFGKEADRQAWLLVQHADQDIAFQRQVLVILEELYPKGETNPSNYAYLFDRVASSPHDVSQRKPQRYGTQGECMGPGQWGPFTSEDPGHLDERRKGVGLETESDYIQRFKTICH